MSAAATISENSMATEDRPAGRGPEIEATNDLEIEVAADGSLLVTKRFREARHYRQERAALLDWAPRLPFAAPRLVEDRGEDERCLVLRGLVGVVPEGERLDDPRLHRSAGAALAALHALPHVDRDRMAPGEALSRRLESLLAEADDRFDDALRRQAARCLERIAELAWPASRVPCHRDYEPRNWIVGPRGFGVIDWEQARPDLAEVDLVKLRLGLWWERPALARAFLDGYGADPGAEAEGRLDVLGFIHALGTLGWARRRRNADFEALGRRQLERLPRF